MLDLHFNTISADQRELLEILGQVEGSVLVGGTSLSLQIGHRRSYDLDFVVPGVIADQKLRQIQECLHNYDLSQRLSSDAQYTAFAGKIKITFFQDVARLLHPEIKFEKYKLASVNDIFSSKLYVMGRRATWRDYVDVAVCIDQSVCSLKTGIEEAIKRYKVNKRWILDPLSYFDDLEMTPIEWVGKEYSDSQVKQILVDAVKDYLY